MMKTIAQVYGSIRRSAEEFRAQVMEADELREPIEEIRAAYHGTKQELLSAQDLARRELGRARAEAMKAQQKLAELAREESRRDVPALKGRVSAKDQLDDDPHHHPPTTSATKPAATPAAATAQVTTEKTATSPAAVAAQVPIEKTATSPAREPTDRSDAA
jgi:hypothetical protein